MTTSSDHTSNPSTAIVEGTLNLQTLASIRSLIINPSTSKPSLSSIFQTLTRPLQHNHHTLKLLSDLAFHHPDFSPLIIDTVRSHSAESTRVSAESLDLLASLCPTLDWLDDLLFVSLCFGPSVSVRLWLLKNAERFHVRPYLLVPALLGFTKDPYPYVRKVALDGLVGICKSGVLEDRGMIEGCYCRAVELVCDMEDCVRSAAVRAVSEWGQMLVSSSQETNKRDWSDALFVQLCSIVRDMNMEVRVEAFDAIGKIGIVSEDILLQSLSKKVLGITKEKKCLGKFAVGNSEVSASSAAGAFVHGLEDEYYQVRKSACCSLRVLTIFSAKFAGETLNLLMGVLNDDSMLVQLQALETMCHMAAYDCLKLQETHMHTFLGTLANKSILIRVAVRKILKLVKLLDFGLFKLCINRLLDNLDIYQQDEADIFSVLFHIGQHHGNFVVCLIKEVLQEIEPADEGKLDFDSGRVAALLVLAISVPPSHEQSACGIPPRIYSYAVTLVGRISRSLGDIIDQNSLLCYLSRCSRSTIISNKEFEEEAILPVVKDDGPIYTGTESLSHYGLHSWKISDRASEVQTQILREQSEVATGYVDYQLELHDKVLKSINLILAMVKDIWPLIQSGCASEALRILRGCKEGLTTFSIDAARYANPLAFSLQYVQAIELIIKVLVHFLPTRKFASDMGDLDLQLGKFERRLREMRCRFIGISKEGELHVLELILLTCVLMLSQVQNFCHNSVLKKLSTTVSLIESVHNEGSIEPSDFFVEVKKSLCEITTSVGDAVKRLLNVFSFRQFMLCGRLKYIHAELDVPDNDSENPFTFVPGLPVSIPFKITLHNVSTKNRLWLKLTIGEELTQFVFLEFGQNGGSDLMRELTYVAPFYRTPTAISFTMRVCIGMELSEDVHLAKGRGGPKKEVVYLCQEKEVYFSMGIRN